jgi:hypothetical protein
LVGEKEKKRNSSKMGEKKKNERWEKRRDETRDGVRRARKND